MTAVVLPPVAAPGALAVPAAVALPVSSSVRAGPGSRRPADVTHQAVRLAVCCARVSDRDPGPGLIPVPAGLRSGVRRRPAPEKRQSRSSLELRPRLGFNTVDQSASDLRFPSKSASTKGGFVRCVVAENGAMAGSDCVVTAALRALISSNDNCSAGCAPSSLEAGTPPGTRALWRSPRPWTACRAASGRPSPSGGIVGYWPSRTPTSSS